MIGVVDGASPVRFDQVANRGFEVQFNPDLRDPSGWRTLDAAGNRAFFSAPERAVEIKDPETDASSRYYRVRVYEP